MLPVKVAPNVPFTYDFEAFALLLTRTVEETIGTLLVVRPVTTVNPPPFETPLPPADPPEAMKRSHPPLSWPQTPE